MSAARRSIVWSARARRDLTSIQDFIAEDDPSAAERWVDGLASAVELAARLPNSGRIVPELQRPEVRELVRGGYRIVYRVESKRILVLTVFEGHMRLDASGLN